MEVIEAIRSRRSVRSFKPDPVPREVLEELIDTCRWAPSASNMQPWEFAIVGGKLIEELKTRLVEKMKTEWDSSRLMMRNMNPEVAYPYKVPQPYRQRAMEIRALIDSYQFPPGTEGLEEKRTEYLFYGGRLYGAPNLIIIYTDKSLWPGVILDVGTMGQTIAMAAPTYGLGTCPMWLPLFWPDLLREVITIPESKLLVLGIAIGYPYTEALVNNFERTRDPLDTFVHWYGV